LTTLPIQAQDASAVFQLLRDGIAGQGHTTVDGLKRALEDPHWIGLKRVQNGELLGAIVGQCVADQAEVHEVAVPTSARRRGHARALVRSFLAAAEARGAETCFLEVRAGNEAALALYRNLGFDDCGRRKTYYADGEDALVLSRPLENVP
jgi:ribosomal-protein-alanine N-acetyltransferase